MLIGYARVSTDDQDLTLQRAALKDAGCKRTFEEKASGAKRDRPELARMLETIGVGSLDELADRAMPTSIRSDPADWEAESDPRQAGDRDQAPPPAATPSPVLDPRCATARANIAALRSGRSDLQLDTDRDGTPDTPLPEAERADQLRMAEASARAFCPPA